MSSPEDLERNYDVIIVLTGGEQRIPTGFDLLESKVGNMLFVTGVHKDYKKSNITTNNRFHENIILDTKAIDTYGNAINAQRWMKTNNYSSALIVTSNYHLPRAMIHFYRVMPNIHFDGYPVASSLNEHDKWWLYSNNWRVLLRSYTKFMITVPLAIVPFIEKTGGLSFSDKGFE